MGNGQNMGSDRRRLAGAVTNDCKDSSNFDVCFAQCATARDTPNGCDDADTKSVCPSTCAVRIATDDCAGNPGAWCFDTCLGASENQNYCTAPHVQEFFQSTCPKTCEGSERRRLADTVTDDCRDSGNFDVCFAQCATARDTPNGCDDEDTKSVCPSTCAVRIATDDCEGNPGAWCFDTCLGASENQNYCTAPHVQEFFQSTCPKTCEGNRRQLSRLLLLEGQRQNLYANTFSVGREAPTEELKTFFRLGSKNLRKIFFRNLRCEFELATSRVRCLASSS